MHNRACFWKHFGRERVNYSQKLHMCEEEYFYPTFSLIWAKLSSKKLFWMRSQTLGLLVNTLTANCEYARRNRGNLPLPIQIQLSKNHRLFAGFFLHFWYLYAISNVLQKNELHSQVFLKLLTLEDVLI